MFDNAEHLRDRARDCRNLAKSAQTDVDATLLEEIGDEFDAEADKLEAVNPE